LEAEETCIDGVLDFVLDFVVDAGDGVRDATEEVLALDFGGGVLAAGDETVLRWEPPGMNSLLPT
jgi:hypothetical protein